MIVETENKEGSPLVSIFCATYNHENYIGQAIEGFLMQQTNFPFEIIITEDKSTDGTALIIREYENKFPEKFVVFYHKENLYSKKIDFFHTEVLPVIKGRYIAWCEGDDYWTDPYKLQKQVDFLEGNPEYVMCFHNAIIKYENNKKNQHQFNYIKTDQNIELKKLINNWIVPTASIIFKRSILPLPDWSNKIYSGDMTLILTAYQQGKIFFIKDKMSVYRKQNNENSLSQRASTKFLFEVKQHMLLYELFNNETNLKYYTVLSDKIEFLKDTEKFALLRRKSLLFSFIYMPIFSVKKIISFLKRNLQLRISQYKYSHSK